MAALVKSLQKTFVINNIVKLINNLCLTPNIRPAISSLASRRLPLQNSAFFHTTCRKYDLMEFFDSEENWGKQRVQVGRSWKLDELRLKSNEDLHKLWYVLLKERNMLLTMEEAAKFECKIFPNPERIDKVNESMSNLESVVQERNRAYYMLETGETGEQKRKLVYSTIGTKFVYKFCERRIPRFMNTKWQKSRYLGFQGISTQKFLHKYKEKLHVDKLRSKRSDRSHAMTIFRRFPNVSIAAMKEKFPHLNIDSIRLHKKSHGHFVPK
ncbi:large ribosomal subunit protein uL29m [Prorops nasuta]|uniref:large ribosomal subunit protein uL29m n=1 Tax=Prorops nasuta TaxID=863751 RepID=UPI0034CF7E3B